MAWDLQVLQSAAAAVKACWKQDALDEGQPLLAPMEGAVDLISLRCRNLCCDQGITFGDILACKCAAPTMLGRLSEASVHAQSCSAGGSRSWHLLRV